MEHQFEKAKHGNWKCRRKLEEKEKHQEVWRGICDNLEYVATREDIDIVNMSTCCPIKPHNLERIMPQLANKILIAAAGTNCNMHLYDVKDTC